eukprot:2423034-Prymnesium_polylepis.1
MGTSFVLSATLDRWGYVDGGTAQCRLTLTAAATNHAVEWVDWLAVQCCGFVHQESAMSSRPAARSPPASGG